jgi:hypothetical protein
MIRAATIVVAIMALVAGIAMLVAAILSPSLNAPDADDSGPDPSYYLTQSAPVATPTAPIPLPTPTCPPLMAHNPAIGVSSLLGGSNCVLEAIPAATPIRGTPTLSQLTLEAARIDTCYGPLRGPRCRVVVVQPMIH